MTTRTMTYREALEQMKAEQRAEWPAGAVACRACAGSGGSFDQHERCDDCMGRGFQLPGDLDAIRDRTFAEQIAFSDRARDA